MLVIRSVVTSGLDDCNELYMERLLKATRKLQMMQNAAAGKKPGTGRIDHILRVILASSLSLSAQFKVRVMTYKALIELGTGYLKGLVSIMLWALSAFTVVCS